MEEDINLNNLIINRMSSAQYQELLANDQINENEIYVVLDEDLVLLDKENKNNKTNVISANTTEAQYPNAQAVYENQLEQDAQIEAVENNINEFEINEPTEVMEGTNISINNGLNKEFSHTQTDGLTINGNTISYMQVEYLRSTSTTHNTNYIDTNIYPTNNTSIEIKFNIPTGSHSYDRVYGATAMLFEQICMNNYLNKWNNAAHAVTFSTETDYVLKVEKNLIYLNGELIHTYAEGTFEDTRSLRLFSGTNADRDSNIKIYYCKIWENDVLMRDFVPVKQLNNDEFGMFDLIDKRFYPNMGTVAFQGGAIVDRENSRLDNYIDSYHAANIGGYTQLEYLESSGTQWIDTEYKPNSNTKIKLMAYRPKLGADSGWRNKAFDITNGPVSFGNERY